VKPWSMAAIILYRLYTQFRVIREAVGTDYPVSLLYNSEECVKPWFVGRDSSITRVLVEPDDPGQVLGALLSAGASPRYLF
jgi:hypothetical protein